MKTLAFQTLRDRDGLTLSVSGEPMVPEEYVCTLGITTPEGVNVRDADQQSMSPGKWLMWYPDGGLVVVIGLDRSATNALIRQLKALL